MITNIVLQKYRNYLKRPKSKKSPTWLEYEYAKSMIEQDQSPQLNSTLQTDNIYETQQLSTDVGDYGVSDIMNNDFPDPSDLLFDLDDELISLIF